MIVSGEPGPTPGDTTAIEVVESLRTGWLTDVAKVVTALGSAAVTGPLAAFSRGAAGRAAALGGVLACWSPGSC